MKLAGALVLLAACSLAGNAAATQYLARTFHYAPALGEPLVVVAGIRVYHPARWTSWCDRAGWSASSHDRSVAFGLALSGPFSGSIVAPRLLWRWHARARRSPRPAARPRRVWWARPSPSRRPSR